MGVPVALRKESVDRNTTWSLSPLVAGPVALRKESVDRNFLIFIQNYNICVVALRKESVDRNISISRHSTMQRSRSPQGERG